MMPQLVPACDRCGHGCDTDKLVDDGLGHVCPKCRSGALPAPKRIQLRRHAGWRKPPGVINVARPSRWGNPFAVGTEVPGVTCDGSIANVRADTRPHAVQAYQRWLNGLWEIKGYDPPTAELIRAELRGHDLACWCPLDQPCHSDVLLKLANSGVA